MTLDRQRVFRCAHSAKQSDVRKLHLHPEKERLVPSLYAAAALKYYSYIVAWIFDKNHCLMPDSPYYNCFSQRQNRRVFWMYNAFKEKCFPK